MLWYLFVLFVGIALGLVYLGIKNPNETASALIGFVFLFLLSFVILGDNLEYKSGETITLNYSYSNTSCSEYGLEGITEYVDVIQGIEGIDTSF